MAEEGAEVQVGRQQQRAARLRLTQGHSRSGTKQVKRQRLIGLRTSCSS